MVVSSLIGANHHRLIKSIVKNKKKDLANKTYNH